jgi:hypothetical protein
MKEIISCASIEPLDIPKSTYSKIRYECTFNVTLKEENKVDMTEVGRTSPIVFPCS